MSDLLKPFEVTHLADYRFGPLTFVCDRCDRKGTYRPATLRAKFHNPPMTDLPRLVAIEGKCQLAVRQGGRACKCRFEIREQHAAPTMLSDAQRMGWRLKMACERHHQGLKVAKPCPGMVEIEVRTLVATFGHTFTIDKLPARLQCPGCGSNAFSLMWIVPKHDEAKTQPLAR